MATRVDGETLPGGGKIDTIDPRPGEPTDTQQGSGVDLILDNDEALAVSVRHVAQAVAAVENIARFGRFAF